MKQRILSACAIACAIQTTAAHSSGVTGASDHAPIGVMVDHRHRQGEVMLSYRFMYMDMEGSRVGTDRISPDAIVTTIPNRFFGVPGQPPTLRVAPTEMSMKMHMVGAMYGLTDRVTLMAMGGYITKDMQHTTYMGGMGTNILGKFETSTAGFGDTTVGAIIGLDNGDKPHNQLNVGLAFSLPTGTIEETGEVLTPMGMRPTLRLPYPMQLGSGTVDFKPSIVGRLRRGDFSIGGQISGVVRMTTNDADYKLGNIAEATVWLAYEPRPWVSVSGRLKGATRGDIEGIDSFIIAPVQTADPRNSGGETLEFLFGVNLLGQSGAAKGHRLAIEFGLPVLRDLNGPQLEADMALTIGWQKAF